MFRYKYIFIKNKIITIENEFYIWQLGKNVPGLLAHIYIYIYREREREKEREGAILYRLSFGPYFFVIA